MYDLTMGWIPAFTLQEGYSPAHSFPVKSTAKSLNFYSNYMKNSKTFFLLFWMKYETVSHNEKGVSNLIMTFKNVLSILALTLTSSKINMNSFQLTCQEYQAKKVSVPCGTEWWWVHLNRLILSIWAKSDSDTET